jgi:hypothetical protein
MPLTAPPGIKNTTEVTSATFQTRRTVKLIQGNPLGSGRLPVAGIVQWGCPIE